MTTAETVAVKPDDRVPIKARRVRFAWEDTPLHWVPDDPQTTHTINVLHLLLPAGEKWFCELYRQVLPDISDERLREDVKGFIGQEATHSRAHAAVLDHLAAQGVETSGYTRLIDWAFEKLLADKPLGLRLPRFLQRQWMIQRLGIIASVEHFTAVLGAWVLDSAPLDKAGADPVMLDLLRWHGAEEVEHRAVAFELYHHMGGAHWRRVVGMLAVATVLLGLWIRGTIHLMRNDPTRPGWPTPRRFTQAARKGQLPTLRSLLGAIPRYFRRDYHPLQEASTAKAVAYLASSPAATAAAARGV